MGLKIGAGSGLILFIDRIRAYFSKPKLKILPLKKERDLIKMKFKEKKEGKKVRENNFFRLLIKNKRKKKAKHCIGVLKISDKKIDKQYDRFFKKQYIPEEYYLHWSDTSYKDLTTRPEPIDIFKIAPAFLDIIFTSRNKNIKGSWIAVHFALNNPNIPFNQFYLPPGEYDITVKVDCLNGRGDKKKYRITSPEQWNELKIEEE